MLPEQVSFVRKMSFLEKSEKFYQNLLKKLKQVHAKPHAIAAGFACGAAISVTPFVGFHLILAILTAFLLRASVVAGALGTVVGNPWTFALIFPTTLYTGRFVLGEPLDQKTNFTHLFENLAQAVRHIDVHLFLNDVWPVLHPMIVGCIPYYIVVWFISYVLIKRALKKYETKTELK